MFTFAKTLYRRVRQGEFPEGQERVPWGTTRRTAVNSFADVYSLGRTVCARAIVKWACPFFDQVSVVPWEHTVLPYGMFVQIVWYGAPRSSHPTIYHVMMMLPHQ